MFRKSVIFTRARFVAACSAIVMTAAAGVLFGWVADIPVLRSLVPGYPEMQPYTAAALILLAITLRSTLQPRESILVTWVPASVGAVTAAVSFAALASWAFHFSMGIDWLIHSGVFSEEGSRVSPNTPLVFLLIGLALTFSHAGGKARWLSEPSAVAALITAFSMLLGQLYNADAPYLMSPVDGMPLQTGILSAVLASAVIARNSRSKLVRLLGSDSQGGSAARRLLPAVILIPTLVGWLHVEGLDRGLYDPGLGSAMYTFTLVLLMLAIVLFYSRAVHRSDRLRRRAEADLLEKEARYHELFDHSQGLICIHDAAGRLTTVNRATHTLLGYSETEMAGRMLRDLVPAEQQPEFDAYLKEVLTNGVAAGLLELISKNGRHLVLRFNNVLVSEKGKEPYVLGHAQDVTELVEAQAELKNLTLTDELTGLYNRRGFMAMAEHQLKLERHETTARGLSVLFLDMDGLKYINDTYGHEAGSDAIATLGRLITSAVRGGDLVARWGGDEFVVLTVGALGESSLLMVDRIQERIAEHNAVSTEPYEISCSIGIAPVDRMRPFDDVIAEADGAMYNDKRHRKAALAVDGEPPVPFIRPWTEHSTRV